MNNSNPSRLRSLAILLSVVTFLLSIMSCQYDYNSPSPGVIEVRLRTVSSARNIAFSPQNNFVITVSTVEAIRSDNAGVPIYEDLNAFNPSNLADRKAPTVVNVLDTLSRDSLKVLGAGYAPPAHYVGIDLVVEPGSVVVLDGYRQINVETSTDFSSLLHFDKPFDVNEGRTTRITLTINLDSTLTKGAEVYYFTPYYYISSVAYE